MQSEHVETHQTEGVFTARKHGVQFFEETESPQKSRYTPLTRTDFDINIVDKWSEIKASNTPKRRCNHTSFIYKDQLYVIGGRDINKGKIADSFNIDLKTLNTEPKWEKLIFNVGNPPEATANHAGDVVENHYYLFGGENIYNQATNNLYIFDIENEQWERRPFNEADIPAMIGHTANYYPTSKLFVVFGGFQRGIYSNSIYIYDNTKWTKVEYREGEKVPKGRIFHTATLVGDSLYVYGGETLDGSFMNDLWRYDLARSCWEEISIKGEVPKGRSGHSCVHYKGSLYIFGGKVGNIQEKNELWKYDISKNAFTLLHDTLLEQNIDYETFSHPEGRKSRSKIL
jgi:N-acetylneuraminic acid mutarotase